MLEEKFENRQWRDRPKPRSSEMCMRREKKRGLKAEP